MAMVCSALEAFQLYLSLKTHFTTKNYDVVKYQGKMKNSSSAHLEKRNDKFLFGKIAKIHDDKTKVANYFIANFVSNNFDCLYDLNKGDKYYAEWRGRKEARKYHLKNDLDLIVNALKENEEVSEHVFKLYLQKKISPETLVFLNQKAGLFKKLEENILWESHKLILEKYSLLLKLGESYEDLYHEFSEGIRSKIT